ncbi:hypothetical protein KAT36_04680 [Candidatus Pacearchaeota archaeon]|nr:hypothetical protein [Candidatus Pacearchaeota archaeon]
MKIAIDIDEVLCETMKSFLDFVRENKGIEKDFEDIFSHNLWEVFEVEEKEINEIFYEIFIYGGSLDLISGAKEGVENLSRNNELFFITSRSMNYFDKTKDFIVKNFISKPQLYFSGDLYGDGKTKDEICEDLEIKLIIEDNGETSLKYAENGLNVLLLDKPWNQKFEHENIFRCFSWDDILEKIRELTYADILHKDDKNEKVF